MSANACQPDRRPAQSELIGGDFGFRIDKDDHGLHLDVRRNRLEQLLDVLGGADGVGGRIANAVEAEDADNRG